MTNQVNKFDSDKEWDILESACTAPTAANVNVAPNINVNLCQVIMI